MQIMRAKVEEFGNRSASDIEAVRTRNNEIMRSAEDLVASLRIEQVHQQLTNLDATFTHNLATLGAHADEMDRRVIELTARLNATVGSGRNLEMPTRDSPLHSSLRRHSEKRPEVSTSRDPTCRRLRPRQRPVSLRCIPT